MMLVVGFRINGLCHVTCCILAFNVRCTLESCDCQVKFVGNDVRVWHVAHARDLRSFAGLRVVVVVYSGCCASMHPFVTPCRSSSQEQITFTRAENGVDDAVLFVERPFGVVDVAPWTHVLLLAPGLIVRCG